MIIYQEHICNLVIYQKETVLFSGKHLEINHFNFYMIDQAF
jgi:hypothetical protein